MRVASPPLWRPSFSIKALPNQIGGNTITASFTLKSYFFLEQALVKKAAPVRPKVATKERDDI